MEHDHCNEKDAQVDFQTSNGITTTSALEWEVVYSPRHGATYPERAGFPEHHPEWCRKFTTIDTMEVKMESECNDPLRRAGHSELIREESAYAETQPAARQRQRALCSG